MRKALLVGALAACLSPVPAALPAGGALAAPVSFRGLDCDVLGSASALVWSPRSNVAEMRCENLGSSGQDGVSVAMPEGTDAWTCVFGPTPGGSSPPDDFALALFDSDLQGAPPLVTWSFVANGGRQRCVPDLPGALDWVVEIWSGDSLVYSARSLSPPVVDLPAGVSACEDGASLGVITNMRTRLNSLEAHLPALGLLGVNGVDREGDRLRIGGHCAQGQHIKSAKLFGRYGGGGGGGAGGFCVRTHAPRVGIGIDVPGAPLGFTVSDGNLLLAPPAPDPGARVALGPGMTAWRATFTDLTRPAALLGAWSVDLAPIPAASLANGSALEFRLPSQWAGAPDTLRVRCADDGSGTGSVIHVMNGDGTKIVIARAYSGPNVLPLAGPAVSPLDLPVAEAPTGFHASAENGDLVVRCPLPAGTMVFSGGFAWPCDSVEVRVRGNADDDCDGFLAGVLAGQQLDLCDLRAAAQMHHIRPGRRQDGVSLSPVGDARLQRLGGDILVHGVSETGEDGVLLSGAGGAIRVRLKDHFENGDIPDQQRFTAVATLGDGTTEDVSTLDVDYDRDANGDALARAKVHGLHRGEGHLFVQFSDGAVCEPEDCDDHDEVMEFRQVVAGGTSMVGSVGYRRDSPWTEVFDVGFSGPVRVTVRGEDRDVLGLRVWRNRGGEQIGTAAPRVSALRVTGRPPAAPVLGAQGVCGLAIEGLDVHVAGFGLEAHGPGSTIDGLPVVPTWARVYSDSTGGVDEDCDDSSDDEGLTLRVAGGWHPVVLDKTFPPADPGGPVRRGLAFTCDLAAAEAASGDAGFEMAAGGSVLGVSDPRLFTFGGKKGYDAYRKYRAQMSAAQSNPLYVRCYSGGVLTAEFAQADSIELSRAPGAVLVGDLDGDGAPDIVCTNFPAGTTVHPPGGDPTDYNCDRVVIGPGGPHEPWALDGACRVSLNGLPPGVPVTGVRLAEIPATDPSLGVTPAGAGRVFALARPWPNPARGALRVRFALPAAARVRARVYDLAGRVVATLADARFAAGEHDLAWDGRADGGAIAPAGLYFLRVTRDGHDALTARFTRLR